MKNILLLLIPAAITLAASSAEPAGNRPPNVVILFSDDAGYAAFGFQPDARPDMAKLTPHIDSIAAAGKPVDAGWKLDGVSLLPLMKEPQTKTPARTLYWRRKGIEGPIALRDGNWKLLLRNNFNSTPELYDLATDIGESNNVAKKHPEVVTRLTAKLDKWESQLVAPLWGPGSPGFVDKPKRKKK